MEEGKIIMGIGAIPLHPLPLSLGVGGSVSSYIPFTF